VQGLRRLAVAAGVRVYEATPMAGLQRSLPAVVKTPSGSVTADEVVLACGARLGLVPALCRTICIIPAHYHDPREIAGVVADVHGTLPATRDLAVEWRWGGPLERTQHRTPWVGVLGRCRLGAAGVSSSGADPLRRRPSRAPRHRALRDLRGRRQEAGPRVAGPQALPQRLGAQGPDAVAPGGDGLIRPGGGRQMRQMRGTCCVMQWMPPPP
jgi:hypothetical protein